MLRMVDVRYSVRIEGQVTYLNFCQRVAPSTLAASYCSRGMARRPAIRISVQKGSAFQICTTIAMVKPSVGSLSQLGPSSAVSRNHTELIRPHSGFSMKRIEKIVGIAGTAHGMMKITDSQRIHVRSCTKKPERKSASANFTFTATIRKTIVFTTVRKNTGSSNSVT